jgi:hypothetical protein
VGGNRRVVLAVVLAVAIAAVSVGSGAAEPSSGRRVVHHLFAPLAVSEQSSNWAGYALRSKDAASPLTFTHVVGTWRQPKTQCNWFDTDSLSAFWVGLGGFNAGSQALEQIGTDADCNPVGPPSYYGWYELVPGPPISFAMKIEPGDRLTASVTVKGKLVFLELRNDTRGLLAVKVASVANPDLSSAEWIAEAPSACWGPTCIAVPLANFGSVAMSKLSATGNAHQGSLTDDTWDAVPIQLLSGGAQVLFPGPEADTTYTSTAGTCSPSTPGAKGDSFTVGWALAASPGC